MEPTNGLTSYGKEITPPSSFFQRILFVLLCLSGLFWSATAFGQITFNVDVLQTTCPGQGTGEIEINNVQGGALPYMYSIDNGMTYGPDPIFSNLDGDTILVRVMDDLGVVSEALAVNPDPSPTAICDRIEASLQNDGAAVVTAEMFDDGSTDNCAPDIWFRIRRMTPSLNCPTDNNPDNMFYDSLKVCCDDLAGDSVQVIFRVYDRDPGDLPIDTNALGGRYSECMTAVRVRDYIPPRIVQCAQHTEADCREDFTDLSRFGIPVVLDNCTLVDTIFRVDNDLDKCRVGTITREFVFVDQAGYRDSCTQIIQVYNADPFNGDDPDDLSWPDDVTIYDCNAQNTHPDSTGYPDVSDDECSQVTYDWEDDVYEFAPDACVKIRRHWTVIDWCQYVRGGPRVPNNGVWNYTQEIKILDTVPPVLTGPADTEAFSYLTNCGPTQVTLPEVVAVDCADPSDMEFRIWIDLFSDGINDDTIPGADASGVYPLGDHRITFVVDDKCNNVSKWVTELSVVDGKAPSPVMINKLIVPLMNMGNGGMATVRASQFNLKSYDNCTANSDLRFSFSPMLSDTIKTYDCDSLGSRQVEIWVTDEAGNQSLVTNCVIIQDNDTICSMATTAQLVGRVETPAAVGVPGVSLELSGGTLSEKVRTDTEGNYAFTRMGVGQSVQVAPSSPDDWMNGISTRDLILIQQHLLGTELFQHPDQFIAADVDRSGHVSIRDIIWLRKLILGVAQAVPGNTSWRFVDASYQFQDPTDPLKGPLPEVCAFDTRGGLQPVNFTAVKVGDLSGDAGLNSEQLESRDRSSGWTWNWTSEGTTSDMTMRAVSSQSVELSGFQIEINSPMLMPGLLESVKLSPVLDNDKMFWTFLENGGIRIVYMPDRSITLESGEDILQLRWSGYFLSAEFDVTLGEGIVPEYYGASLLDGRIRFSSSSASTIEALIAPNPSQGQTMLTLNSGIKGTYQIDIYGLSGFRIRNMALVLQEGDQQNVQLTLPTGSAEGLYLVRILAPDGAMKILKWQYQP